MKTKNRRLTSILCLLLVGLFAVGMTSCSTVEKICPHVYGAWSTTKAATCTETGIQERTCAVCKNVEQAVLETTSHDFAEATCSSPKTCKTCSATEGDVADHAYTVEEVKDEALKSAATSTAAAVYYKSCACGAISTLDADTFTSGDPLVHAHEYTVKAEADNALKSPATCAGGAVYYKSCACGAVSQEDSDLFTVGEPLDHKDDDHNHTCDYGCDKTDMGAHADSASDNDHVCDYGCGATLEACADKENDGDHACEVCKKADVSAHNYGDATCGSPATCLECGASIGDVAAHIYNQSVVKAEALKDAATCTSAAVYYKSCSCGAISANALETFADGAPLSHKDENLDHVCDYDCGKTDIGAHADSATDRDHLCDYGCGAVLEACSDASGDNNHTCDVCGGVDVTEHTYGDATCGSPATCSECGATTGATLAHKDDNHDHVCDNLCGKNDMGEHADSDRDSDHTCDYGCGAVLEACADSETDNDHACDVCHKADVSAHAYAMTASVNATCTTAAKNTYRCNCGDVYEELNGDALGHDVTDVIPTERENGGCAYVLVYVCKRSGCGAEVLGETVYHHNYVASITTPATCQENGVKTLTCTCGDTKTELIAKDATGHNWVKGTPSNGTRTDACSYCNETKAVTVYEGTKTDSTDASSLKDKEIELNDANISLDNGVIDTIGDQQITVSADKLEGDDRTDLGLSDDQLAQVGDSPIYNFTINNGSTNISNFGDDNWVTITLPYTLSEGEDVDSIAVWFINDNGELESIKATYNNGYVTFKTNHFSYYTVTRLTPAERCALYGHGYVGQHVEGNCTKDEYDLYVCVRCHDKYVDEATFIAGDGHDYEAEVTAPTCTAEGLVVYTCRDCGHTYSTKQSAIGHAYAVTATVPATCTADGYTTYSCANCAESYTVVSVKAAHAYVSTVVPATCQADGYTVYTCNNCSYRYTDTYVTATGHNYVDSEWKWSADYGSATLTLVCTKDEKHIVMVNATVSTTVINGTCSNFVKTVYTATVSYNGAIYTDEKSVSVGTPDHVFSTEWTKNDTAHWHECICGEKADYTKHAYTGDTLTKAPTCAADGESTAYCVCGETKVTVIPATGEHNYQDGFCTGCGAEFVDTYYLNLVDSLKDIDGFAIKLQNFSYEIKRPDDSLAGVLKLFGSIKQINVAELMLFFEDGKIGGAAYGSFEIYNGPIAQANAIYNFKAVIHEDNVYVTLEYGKDVANKTISTKITVDALLSAIFEEMGVESSYLDMMDFYKATLIPAIDTLVELHKEDVDKILENAFNMIFTFTRMEDGTYVATLDFDKLRALNDNLATKPVSEVLDLYFGEGTFDSLVDFALEILNLKASEVPGYLDRQGLDSAKLMADFNDLAQLIGAPADFDIEAILMHEDLADYTLGMLIFEVEDDEYLEYVDELVEFLRETSLYAMICGEIGLGGDELQEVIDTLLDMIADSVEISFTTDRSGMLTAIRLGAENCEIEQGDEMFIFSMDLEIVMNERINVTWMDIITSIESGIVEPTEEMKDSPLYAYCNPGYSGDFTFRGEEIFFTGGVYVTVYKTNYDEISYIMYQQDCQGWMSYEYCYADYRYTGYAISVTIDGVERSFVLDSMTGEAAELIPTATGFTVLYEDGSSKDIVLDPADYSSAGLWYADIYFAVFGEEWGVYEFDGDYVDFYYNASLKEYSTESQHSLKEEYVLSGETCDDGCLVLVTCEHCDYLEQHERYYCDFEYVTVELAELGTCGGYVSMSRCTRCGKVNYINDMYIVCEFTSESDILNDQGEVIGCAYTCATCGCVFEAREWTEVKSSCEYAECQSLYIYKNGEEIFSYTLKNTNIEHDYEYTFDFSEGNCESGFYTIVTTCTKCGDQTTRRYRGHCEEYKHHDLYNEYGLCGGYYEERSCIACETVMYSYVSDYDCSWQYKGETADGFEEYYCRRCGATKFTVRYDSEKDENCTYTSTQIGIYLINGEEIFRYERTMLREDHDYHYEYILNGISCEDGYTIITTCANCSLRWTEKNDYHDWNAIEERIDLTEYGACDGYIEFYSCICGQQIEMYFYSCYDRRNTNQYYDELGRLVSVETRTCSSCNLRYTKSYYTVSDPANCSATDYYTVMVSVGGVLVFEKEYQNTYDVHDYNVQATLMDGISCEGGVRVEYSCKTCGYNYRETYYSHQSFEKERIDLAALGNVCGGYVSLYGCACGEQIHLYLEENSLCDWGCEWCEVWVDGAISGSQYNVEGYCSFWNEAYVYICAVTDPAERACGFKVRYARYWKKDANSCRLYRYETWQFGYDEETGTCLYEVTYKTGEESMYHNYVDNSFESSAGKFTRYNCPDCGSYYYDNNYYANDHLVKHEVIAENTLDNGHDWYYESVSEYAFDANGNRYCCREYYKRIYAYGDEYWYERLNVESVYYGPFGEPGRKVVSSYTNANGEHSSEEYAYVYYQGYPFEIYRYTVENNWWERYDYSYSFTANGCFRTTTYTNSYGEDRTETEQCCLFYIDHVSKYPTCTQDGYGYDECVVCGYCTTPSVIPPNDHNWVELDWNWYYCFACGLENANGVSGSIIMEDLTDAYGNGEYYVVGYYLQNGVDFSQYVSLILPSGEEVAIWSGIDFVTIGDLRAVAFSKAAVDAWAAANGYTDYDVRFSFVPVGSDGSFDYGITFTETIDIDTIIDSVSFKDFVGSGEVKTYTITPTKDGSWTFMSVSGGDTYATLYSANGKYLTYDDDGAGNGQFYMTYYLKAGQTYTVEVRWYSSSVSGNMILVFNNEG